jgi:hypothetical protein
MSDRCTQDQIENDRAIEENCISNIEIPEMAMQIVDSTNVMMHVQIAALIDD